MLKMSQVQIQLTFNRRNGVYFAGEKLAGILCIIINASDYSSTINTIDLIIDGKTHNYWVNKNSDKIYEKLEQCLRSSIKLPPSKPTSINTITGAKNYSFEFDLSENLPSTFEGEFGQTSYTVAVELFDDDGKLELHEEKSFIVISKVDLSKNPATMQPVEAVDTTDFSCCSCFPFGTVRTVVTIPKNGFLPKETIPVNVIVYNGTRRKLTDAKLVLIQKTKFYAKSRYENAEDQKEWFIKVVEMNKGTIFPHRFLRMKSELVIVPNVVPTYDSGIISISYMLRLCANPELEVDIPITIGTEPTLPCDKGPLYQII